MGAGHTGGALTVRQAMLVFGLREARAIAGRGGLDRRITGVMVLEAPETLRFVVAGDLLLTMGFAFKDDSDAQSSVVGDLARAGSAGLVVRPKPYLGQIPPAMAAQADELAYPLLAIPEHVAYDDIALPIVQQRLMCHSRPATSGATIPAMAMCMRSPTPSSPETSPLSPWSTLPAPWPSSC